MGTESDTPPERARKNYLKAERYVSTESDTLAYRATYSLREGGAIHEQREQYVSTESDTSAWRATQVT